MTNYSQFGASIIVILFFPLLPIVIEPILNGGVVTDQSLTITAAVYTVSIGASSRKILFLLASIFINTVFAACFGFILAKNTAPFVSYHGFTLFIIGVIIIYHIVERYTRHVTEGELFLQPFK